MLTPVSVKERTGMTLNGWTKLADLGQLKRQIRFLVDRRPIHNNAYRLSLFYVV